MISHVVGLGAKMKEAISRVDSKLPLLEQSGKTIRIVQDTIGEIKAWMRGYAFADLAEEVWYYKNMMPRILSERQYYSSLVEMEIEKRRLHLRPSLFRLYLESEQAQLDRFFEKNRSLYEYVVRGESISDEAMFTKARALNDELDDVCCTPSCFILGQLLAKERVREYLAREFFALDHPELEPGVSGQELAPQTLFEWRGTKSDATEFVVGIYVGEVLYIDNRPANISEIRRWFEKTFGVDLKDFKNFDYANRIRKKDPNPLFNRIIKQSNDRSARLNK